MKHLTSGFYLTFLLWSYTSIADVRLLKYYENFFLAEVDSRSVVFNCESQGEGELDAWSIAGRGSRFDVFFVAAHVTPKWYCEKLRKKVQTILRKNPVVRISGNSPIVERSGKRPELFGRFGCLRGVKSGRFSEFPNFCHPREYWLNTINHHEQKLEL